MQLPVRIRALGRAVGLAGVVALVWQPSARAETRGYALTGDHSSVFPTEGTIMHPGAVSGRMVLVDDGAGTVTLGDFVIRSQFTDVVHSTTGCPPVCGTFMAQDTTLRVAPGQTGSGSVRSSVEWGALTGWTWTGTLFCRTECPPEVGPCEQCLVIAGFVGTGPGPSPKSSSFNTDPWRFDEFGNFLAIGGRCPGGSAVGSRSPDPTDPNDPVVCTVDADCPGTCSDGQGNPSFPCPCTDTIEVAFLEPAPGLIIRQHARFLGNPVPAVPLLGAAVLAAALLYAGVRFAGRGGRSRSSASSRR